LQFSTKNYNIEIFKYYPNFTTLKYAQVCQECSGIFRRNYAKMGKICPKILALLDFTFQKFSNFDFCIVVYKNYLKKWKKILKWKKRKIFEKMKKNLKMKKKENIWKSKFESFWKVWKKRRKIFENQNLKVSEKFGKKGGKYLKISIFKIFCCKCKFWKVFFTNCNLLKISIFFINF